MKSPIFCYHKVGPVEAEGRFLNVTPGALSEHVHFLKRRFRICCLRDLAAAWEPKSAVLTFDDAYLSTLTYGLEVLTSASVPATFFAVPGLVGRTSEWDGARARPLAPWHLLELAHSKGHEIANHTRSHADLSQLALAEQTEEWATAQAFLRTQGFEPVTGCYPFGRMNNESEQAVLQAGLQVAVSLKKGWAKASDSRTALPRIVIACSDRIPHLLYKLYVRPWLP